MLWGKTGLTSRFPVQFYHPNGVQIAWFPEQTSSRSINRCDGWWMSEQKWTWHLERAVIKWWVWLKRYLSEQYQNYGSSESFTSIRRGNDITQPTALTNPWSLEREQAYCSLHSEHHSKIIKRLALSQICCNIPHVICHLQDTKSLFKC